MLQHGEDSRVWGDREVSLEIPQPRPIDQRITAVANSKHFLPALSYESLRNIPEEHLKGAVSVFGVGCTYSNGPSAGVPIERLAMDFRAILFHKLFGLEGEAICLVCETLAYSNPAMTRHKDEIGAISNWHRQVSNKLRNSGLSIFCIVDKDIEKNSDFQAVLDRLPKRSYTPSAAQSYADAQTARFEYLALNPKINGRFKGGWAITDNPIAVKENTEKALQSGHGMDEASFDELSFKVVGKSKFAAYYGIPAYQPTQPYETACPYTAKPGTGRLLLDRRSLTGNIINDQLAPLAEPGTSSKSLSKHCRYLDSLWSLAELGWEVIPDLTKPSGTEKERIESAESSFRSARAVLECHGKEGDLPRDERKAFRTELQQLNIGLHNATQGLWAARKPVIASVCKELIDRFGVDL